MSFIMTSGRWFHFIVNNAYQGKHPRAVLLTTWDVRELTSHKSSVPLSGRPRLSS